MYKPIKLITKIDYGGFSTYYLYYKNTKTLLPIEINGTPQIPSIYNTLKRLIFALGGKAKYIKIYKVSQNTLYTYLTLEKEGQILDVSIGFPDAIEIARESDFPIFAKEEIIREHGIKITEKIVKRALISD